MAGTEVSAERGPDAGSALRAALDAAARLVDASGCHEGCGELSGLGARHMVELIGALENVKDAASAAQAELAVAFLEAERARARSSEDVLESEEPAGVESASGESAGGESADAAATRARRRDVRARRSAVAQVALARRESPHRAGVLVGMAEALVGEMPHTLAALRAGALNEYRAMLLVKETACLSREARAQVDREICGDPRSLAGVGTRRLVANVKERAYRLDPASVVARAERSAAERCVTLRPAPGSMTYLTALLPLAQGVAALANLQRAAQSARAAGDGRSKGQVMADTLVERLTGQADAEATPVTVNLVMSDETLLAAGHEAAMLDGALPVPAQLARELVARALTAEVEQTGEAAGSADARAGARRVGAWVRRLYADAGGDIVAMDSRSRAVPAGLAAVLRVRDQGLCRTPWCDAPVAHLDHIIPVLDGGATSAVNLQGLCEACNYTKQAPGWAQHVDPSAPTHHVVTETPVGLRYSSTARAVPGALAGGADRPGAAEPTPTIIEIYPPHPAEPLVEMKWAAA